MNTPFEKRICYTICICQLIAVLSCVSLVYLTVAVYKPSYLTLQSGFSEDPVMCTTTKNHLLSCEPDEEEKKKLQETNETVWYSCGEWCLTNPSGMCTQLRVDVRVNGSNLMLENCAPPDVKYCDGVNPKMEMKSCMEGKCAELEGIFNCSMGPKSATGAKSGAQCRNLTSVLSCTLTTLDTPRHCSGKRQECKDLEGLYLCSQGVCEKILPPYKCEKRCISIKTANKNVLIRQNDVIYTMNCGKAVELEGKGEVWPKIGQPTDEEPGAVATATGATATAEPPFLLIFCTNVVEVVGDEGKIMLTDCFNGTLLNPGHFGQYTNITYILSSHLESTERGTRLITPLETNLLIKEDIKLKINFEGCVNTLMGECDKFHSEYGSDGSDMRSQSRFQCYYAPNDSSLDYVVLRFSRMRTALELLIATCVPVSLAIISCTTLVICSRVIHIGDDSRLKFQCCGDEAQKAMEKEAVSAMAL